MKGSPQNNESFSVHVFIVDSSGIMTVSMKKEIQ
jgi:hypothetical protein